MTSSDVRKTQAVVLLLAYFAVRFVFDSEISRISPYLSYGFEAIFVAAAAALFSHGLEWRISWSRETALHGYGAFAAGAVILFLGKTLGLTLPFDLHSTEIVVFLLVIGPILEEFVFRLAHWDVALVLVGEREGLKREVPWAYTSALFSFAHFFAYFYVPPELKSFVIYQAAYTLLLGTYCGWCRLRSRGIWLPILVHLCFNLGFFAAAKLSGADAPAATPSQQAPAPEASVAEPSAPHLTADRCPRVLIVDVPVEEEEVRRLHPSLAERFTLVKNLAPVTKLSNRTCATALEHSEQLIELQKGKIAAPRWLDQSAIEEVRSTLEATHGYHVLHLVAQDTTCAKIYFVGLPPTNPQRLADAARYRQEVAEEWAFVKATVQKILPHIVSVSASESYSENMSDLKENGYSEADANKEALEVTSQWKEIWLDLLRAFPETTFFVAAGNGGLDWKGDTEIDESKVADASFPAFLQANNLFPVASIDPRTNCLSGFSNFGAPKVRVAAIGELNESPVPCASRPALRLSGTSQATAVFANKLVRAFESGGTADELFKNLERPACLNGKVELGF